MQVTSPSFLTANNVIKIAVQGCCHGELHKIYRNLADLEAKKNTKVDLLIICGDFQVAQRTCCFSQTHTFILGYP